VAAGLVVLGSAGGLESGSTELEIEAGTALKTRSQTAKGVDLLVD